MIDSKKSILILGTGYIGSSIIDAFYDSHNIIAIDHGKNFQKLKNKFPEVNFVIGDCTNKIILDEYAKQSNFVFYTLNTGGVMDCILNPEKFKKINISDFKIILDILNKYNLNFILFSSSLNYVILRLSNIYGFGPFLNLGNLGVIEKFINLTFSKKQITLHGNGLQKLDCMYIDDLIELLKLLLNKPFSSNVFNVSSEKNYSVLEISKIIEQHAMKNFQINLKLTSSENSYTLPNSPLMFSNKIKNFVPWIPKQINIKKKIEQMMDEFSKHIG